MDHGHDVAAFPHGDGLGAAWGALGLLACLLVLGFALARDDAARARLLALWAVVRGHPAVTAVVGHPRPAGPAGGDRGTAAAPVVAAPVASAPVDAAAGRPDPALVASFPPELRDVLVRTDELVAGLSLPTGGATWPARALAEHRRETVRGALVDLVDTFAQVPPDLAAQPAAGTGTSPLQDALAAAGLLEGEVASLRLEVLDGLAAELRRQRAFLADKYRASGEASTLDLS